MAGWRYKTENEALKHVLGSPSALKAIIAILEVKDNDSMFSARKAATVVRCSMARMSQEMNVLLKSRMVSKRATSETGQKWRVDKGITKFKDGRSKQRRKKGEREFFKFRFNEDVFFRTWGIAYSNYALPREVRVDAKRKFKNQQFKEFLLDVMKAYARHNVGPRLGEIFTAKTEGVIREMTSALRQEDTGFMDNGTKNLRDIIMLLGETPASNEERDIGMDVFTSMRRESFTEWHEKMVEQAKRANKATGELNPPSQ